MGQPVSATVVYDDGHQEEFADLGAALERARDGRVEYHYAYGPELLPPTDSAVTDMWRYRSLLPLADGPIRYPLEVGGTPLIAPPGLRAVLGLPNLWLKDETRTPTGSNKDRATALVLEHAIRDGAETVSCASTGNVAVSLAVGAAAAGKGAVIFVPPDVAESKLSLMLLAGATVVKVVEGYEQAFRLSELAAQSFGWYDRNTGFNPVTLEAKKTVAFEIWEQLGREMPDVVVSPVGDGVTLAALAKGFRELVACGMSDRVPRMIGVQALGCAPLARAWSEGTACERVEPHTIADGIAVGMPVSAGEVLRDVRQTGGGFVTVPDEALRETIGLLARSAGVLAEPAGAAASAGLSAAIESGLLDQGESVVALVSGTLLKNLQHMPVSGDALEVHADLEELHTALTQTGILQG